MSKRKIFLRTVATVLAVSMMLGVSGCSNQKTGENREMGNATGLKNMEAEKATVLSFDAIGGKDVMPIVGYYGPKPLYQIDDANELPDQFTDEYFSLIASTGINIVGHNKTDYAVYPSLVIKMLELSEKYGMGLFVTDSRIQNSDPNLTVEMVDEYLNEYINYPAYCGNDVIDEPDYVGFYGTEDSAVIMHQYFPMMERLNKLNVFGVTNLLPMKAGDENRYEEYVDAWLEGANPKVLSYDYYPFDGNEGLGKAVWYFENLAIIRKAAEREGIPFWPFIQAGSQWNDGQTRFDSNGYYPSQGEFYWNVGTVLAYGAKAIQYFPMIQPYAFAWAESTPLDAERNGFIGVFGNKTRWYYYAQDMNKQVAAVDEVLMNAVNKGVLAVGKQANEHLSGNPYLLKGTSWRELEDVKGDAMIGCFNYNGKTALYVVNYDTQNAQKIELELVDKCNVTVVQDAKEQHLATNKLSLNLIAGNSALVVFE